MATSNNTANTNAVTKEQVAKIYVATFDRAPDAAGLDYWVNSGLTIQQIAESFFAQDETKQKYPDGLTEADFVNEIYNNLFNRDAEPNGLDYWTDELQADRISKADMILAIVNGAQGDDAKILDNKTEVGLAFADAGLNDYDNAVEVMKNIDATDGSVKAAMKQIEDWELMHADFDLTKNDDTITGTDKNDSIMGKVTGDNTTTTLNSKDKIDGAEGDDTLKIENTSHSALTTAAATVKNIENLTLIDNGTSNLTLNLKNFDNNLKTITLIGSNPSATNIGTGTSGENIHKLIDTITLKKSASSSVIVNTDDNLLDGDDDSVHIVVDSNKQQTVTYNGIENLNITANSSNANLTFNDNNSVNGLKNVTIDGEGDLSLSLSTKAVKIDATAMGGGLSDGSATTNTKTLLVSDKDTELQGSKFDDTLGVPATQGGYKSVIHGNEGDDSLVVGNVASANSTVELYGDSGEDTLTLSAAVLGNIILDGGIDNDTIVVSQAGSNGSNDIIRGIGGEGSDTFEIDGGSSVNGSVKFEGNDGDDTFKIDTANTTVAATVTMEGGKGKDEFDIDTKAKTLTIKAQDDDDTIKINDAITTSFKLDAGTGDDSLSVNANSGDTTIDMGDGSDIVKFAAGVTFGSNIIIDAGKGADDITLNGTIGTTPSNALAIKSGDGNDKINIGATIDRNNMSLDSGDGDDTIKITGNIDNSTQNASATFDLGDGNNTLDITGNLADTPTSGATSNTNGVKTLEINGGDNEDKITISGNVLIDNGTVTIDTGKGNDTIDLSAATYQSIASSSNNATITIDAGEGVDTIKLKSNNTAVQQEKIKIESGDSGVAQGLMDKVSNFDKNKDKIDVVSMPTGSGAGSYDGSNYTSVSAGNNFIKLTHSSATFSDLKNDADHVFNDETTSNVQDIVYAYGTDGTNGYLFIDTDQSHAGAEMAIELVGLTSNTDLLATDIA